MAICEQWLHQKPWETHSWLADFHFMFLIQSQHSHLPLELWDLSLPVATKCSLLKVSEYAIWRRKLVAHKCSSSFLPIVNICFYGIIQLFCGGNEFYSHTFNTEDHSMHIHWFRSSIKEVSRSCLNYLLLWNAFTLLYFFTYMQIII